MSFLDLLISFLEEFNSKRKEMQEEFKRRKEEFDKEWNKWHNSSKIKVRFSGKYR